MGLFAKFHSRGKGERGYGEKGVFNKVGGAHSRPKGRKVTNVKELGPYYV